MADITVPLSKPIKAHGEETKTLTFRAMKVGDLRGFKVAIGEEGLTLDLGSLIDLGGDLAGVPPSTMDTLDLADLIAIGKAVSPLLEQFLQTGKTSSP